jgi:hypothetical protein
MRVGTEAYPLRERFPIQKIPLAVEAVKVDGNFHAKLPESVGDGPER